MQYGFVIDHRKCIGCHACTVACKSENEVPVAKFRTWVKYTEVGSFPQVKRHFAVLRCNQCTNAPCVTICPVNALGKRGDGIVDLDKDACIGCKACMQACPYDAIYLNEDTGGAEKCHYCAHRVEQNLKPACEVVCPEEAIISGDLHDPASKVSKLVAELDTVVRRPEQGTGPNVHYLGMDPVSLHPGRAAEPETYLWSDRRLPPPDMPSDFPIQTDARTVLDVNHDVHWGFKVWAYLWTKGVSAGAAILAPLWAAGAAPGFARDYAPEVLALTFLVVTLGLLIADLKRPQYFFRLMTRPNTKSWLVKGGWVLSAFGGVTAAVIACRFLGYGELADQLRIANVPLGVLTAIYTAFLFAQCEGRDLWQDVSKLSIQLAAQALMLGGAFLLPFASGLGASEIGYILGPASVGFGGDIALLALWIGTAGHVLVAVAKIRGSYATDNARQAVALLPRIPVIDGGELSAFRVGLWLSTAAPIFAVTAAVLGVTGVATSVAALSVASVGLVLYEKAFVRAAQLPPLS
ncbi:MAG: 4Fe-4S binding protein [Planctomycetota bacterium]|nr:4Fe-4S binding protein [Planctomycetota bacterium]